MPSAAHYFISTSERKSQPGKWHSAFACADSIEGERSSAPRNLALTDSLPAARQSASKVERKSEWLIFPERERSASETDVTCSSVAVVSMCWPGPAFGSNSDAGARQWQ